MIDALKSTLTELLGSKKFLILLATVIAAGAAKLGWHIDTDAILPYLGLAASAIVAQGIADHGKSAAEVNAAAAAKVVDAAGTIVVPPVMKQGGFVRLHVMIAIVALGAFLLAVGCGPKTKATEQAFVDCLEDKVKAEVPQLLPAVLSILESGVTDWKAQLEALAQYAGPQALACAVQTAQQQLLAKPAAGSGDSGASRASSFIKDHGWTYKF